MAECEIKKKKVERKFKAPLSSTSNRNNRVAQDESRKFRKKTVERMSC